MQNVFDWITEHQSTVLLVMLILVLVCLPAALSHWNNKHMAAGSKTVRRGWLKRRRYNNLWAEIDAMDGTGFEQWCAELLCDNGFDHVELTGQIGDQGVDILAIKDEISYAIQCKCYTADLGNTPIQEVFTGKQIYGCHVAAVMTNRYFTTGAREAAEATKVLLWDRDKLDRFMESRTQYKT